MIEKKKKWKLADFDYALPEKYIAQYPAKRRDQSKLMVIHKDSGEIEHKTFSNLPDYFKKNDLLITNKIPSRLDNFSVISLVSTSARKYAVANEPSAP